MKIINKFIQLIGIRNILLFGAGITILSVILLIVFMIFNISGATLLIGVALGNISTGIIVYLKEKGDEIFSLKDIFISLGGSGLMSTILLFLYYIIL